MARQQHRFEPRLNPAVNDIVRKYAVNRFATQNAGNENETRQDREAY